MKQVIDSWMTCMQSSKYKAQSEKLSISQLSILKHLSFKYQLTINEQSFVSSLAFMGLYGQKLDA